MAAVETTEKQKDNRRGTKIQSDRKDDGKDDGGGCDSVGGEDAVDEVVDADAVGDVLDADVVVVAGVKVVVDGDITDDAVDVDEAIDGSAVVEK